MSYAFACEVALSFLICLLIVFGVCRFVYELRKEFWELCEPDTWPAFAGELVWSGCILLGISAVPVAFVLALALAIQKGAPIVESWRHPQSCAGQVQ